jgi:hypothetical protein
MLIPLVTTTHYRQWRALLSSKGDKKTQKRKITLKKSPEKSIIDMYPNEYKYSMKGEMK